MNTIKIISVSIFILTIFTNISAAQNVLTYQCTLDDIQESIDNVRQTIVQIEDSLSSEHIQLALDLLKNVEDEARKTQSKCIGWNFAGDSTDALGPLELEAGVYILEYKVDVAQGPIVMGTLAIDFENLDAEEFIFDSVLEILQQAGEQTSRKTVRLKGGRYLISVDAANLNGWTISLSKP